MRRPPQLWAEPTQGPQLLLISPALKRPFLIFVALLCMLSKCFMSFLYCATQIAHNGEIAQCRAEWHNPFPWLESSARVSLSRS